MVKVENLSFEVPVKELYQKISFEINLGEHCVLIGSNGVGKSTLINMLVYPEDYLYDGKIIKENCHRIGYANQQTKKQEEADKTVWEFLAEEFVRLQTRMEVICEKMSQEGCEENVFTQYQEVLDEIEAVDGNNYESNIKKQLNLTAMDHLENHLISAISGGEYKLLQLMKEMLMVPDLLILDEPDAFLDFKNLVALKKLINTYNGTLLVITHNRYLLNHCFNKVLHLENKDLQEFEGSFTEYNHTLLLHKIEQQEQVNLEQEEIERTEKMVDRMQKEASRADIASLGRALHAKQTHLERLKKRAIKAPFLEIRRPKISFPEILESSEEKVLVKIEDYSLSFEKTLLENITFQIKEGEKIALVGENGSGKTTLLHHIFEENHEGIWKSEDCRLAFLSQMQQEMLTETNRVSRELEKIGMERKEEKKEAVKKYCFEEDFLQQKVSQLSGGEKNLLQLLMMGASEANVLLLDEPTSHLDTYAQMELENAIKNYKGTVLMVAHDYDTIVNCVDYVLLVEDKGIRKVRMRTFRKMIYEKYFDKEYLELAEKKKELEERILSGIQKKDLITARRLWEELEDIIKKMGQCTKPGGKL